MAGDILGLILASLLAFGFSYFAGWLFRQDAQSRSRVRGMPSSTPEHEFRGASGKAWPATRLELFGSGLRLSGGEHPLRRLLPVWEAGYEELREAQLVSSRHADPGIRFEMRASEDSTIFWSRQSAEILDHLQAHGVVVDRRPRRLLRQPGEAYQPWQEQDEPRRAQWDWRTIPAPWPTAPEWRAVLFRWGWRKTVRTVGASAVWAVALWVLFFRG